MSPSKKPRCPRCGGSELEGPAPVRTTAHPNSSFLVVETAGAHLHDFAVQGTVCLSCGGVDLSLPAPTLEAFREGARRTRGR